MTPDHSSEFVPMPERSATRRGATWEGSLEKFTDPGGFAVPHCDPQNTRYTRGGPVVMPSSPGAPRNFNGGGGNDDGPREGEKGPPRGPGPAPGGGGTGATP